MKMVKLMFWYYKSCVLVVCSFIAVKNIDITSLFVDDDIIIKPTFKKTSLQAKAISNSYYLQQTILEMEETFQVFIHSLTALFHYEQRQYQHKE